MCIFLLFYSPPFASAEENCISVNTGLHSAEDSRVIDGGNVSFCVTINGWRSSVELLAYRQNKNK